MVTFVLAVCIVALAFTLLYIMFATDKRLDALEEVIKDDDIEFDEISEVVNYNSEASERAINENSDDIEGLAERYDWVKEELVTVDEVLANIEDRLEALEEKSQESEGRIDLLERAMADNEIEDIKLEDRISVLEDNLEFTYDALVSHIDDNEKEFDDIHRSIAEICLGAMALCNKVGNLDERMNELGEDIKNHKETAFRRYEDVCKELASMYSIFEDLKEHVNEIDRNLRATKDDVRSARNEIRDEALVRKVEKLWEEANDRYALFLRAREEGYPEEILDREYDSYINYYNMASLAQQKYNGEVKPVKRRYS